MLVRHDRTDGECLVDEAAWQAVVSFFGGDGGGMLIAERWVLTAAHTAANIPPAHRFMVGEREAGVARVVAHPDGADLAVVELDGPAGVAPFALYDGAGEAGLEVLLLGRGDHGNGRDSGGPALLGDRERLLMAGVSSWQDHDGPLGTYGCVEHYARVSTQLQWIRAVCGL